MNAVLTVCMAVGYIAAACVAALVFLGAGSVWPRGRIAAFSHVVEAAIRIALGMGYFGLLTLVLGLAGLLYKSIFIPMMIGAGVYGVWQHFRGAGILDRIISSSRTGQAHEPRRRTSLGRWWWDIEWSALHTIIAVFLIAFGVNVLFGALSPDGSQDALWYHLGCARAWAEWHRLSAPPFVYAASFFLHNSALYTAVLLAGNGILCSLVYCMQGLLCYTIAAGYARAMFGRRAGWWTLLLCAAGHGTLVWYVPINTGSDLGVAMYGTGALVISLHALFYRSQGECRASALAAAGFLAGFCVSTKLPGLGFVYGPCLILWLFAAIRRPQLRRSAFQAFAISLVPIIAWCARNIWWGCGNPVFPVLRNYIPLGEGYEAFERIPKTVNEVWLPTAAGLSSAIANLPRKLKFAVNAGSPAFAVQLLLVFAVFSRSAVWRMVAVIVAMQSFVYLLQSGYNETIRYFAVVFPFGMIWAGAAVDWLHREAPVRRSLRTAGAVFVILLFTGSYVQKQYRWANFNSVGWWYRPVLTVEDQLTYLEKLSNDLASARLYDWVNHNTPRSAVILFGDISHPFHVKRRYLWADPDLVYLYWIEKQGVSTPDDARKWLSDHNIDYVIAARERVERSPLWSRALRQVSSTPTPAQLYEAAF